MLTPLIEKIKAVSFLTSLLLSLKWSVGLLVMSSFGCRAGAVDSRPRSAESSSKASEGTVEVTGEASDERPEDFKRSGDSVQIGGTNLADTTQRTVVIYQLSELGKREFSRTLFTGKAFSVTVRAGSYYSFEVPEAGNAALLPVAPKGQNTKARLVLNRITTIGAELASIIAEKAKAGDVSSSAVLRDHTLAARDVLTLASMVGRLVNVKPSSGPGVPVDLTRLATDLATATVKKTEGYSKAEYASRVANAAYSGPIYSPSSGNISTEAAAFRTSNPGENDPAREAAMKYSKENKNEEAIDHYDAAKLVAEKYSNTNSTEALAAYNSAYASNEVSSAPVEPPPQPILPPVGQSSSPESSPPSPEPPLPSSESSPSPDPTPLPAEPTSESAPF